MTETIIDDQDLSHVHYNGTWIKGGSTIEHDETVASSTVVGDSFSVDFFGTSITVYGTIDITSSGVLSNYSVDGAPPEQMSSQAGQGDTPNQQFWKSPTLNVGQHHLQVTMVKVNTNAGPGEGTIWFDYFRVTDPTIRSPSASSHKHRIGAIVGGVVGGVVLTLVVLHFIIFRGRKKRASQKPLPFPRSIEPIDAESPSCKQRFTPFPFTPTRTVENSSPTSPSESVASTSPNTLHSRKLMALHQTQVPTHSTSGPLTAVANSTNSSLPLSHEENRRLSTIQETIQSAVARHNPGVINIIIPQATTPPSTVSSAELLSQPVQHIDSGVRAINIQPEDALAGGVELPPIYSPV
ncbi:hypothetical protein JR316_0011892 [Psilocybe cubensis]|uniref:Uncharacterized protein n=2 Tax=Psilocybe cubensis TaxID=181762 RepID=A0ACB8GLN7_PSICU|nr:hypothetical protein JR316_0011892 [Psilocybe cubensis]KAH9476317.1 hypothetical protein JR316_0011892 [Psilocybe cubensis]